MPELLQVLERLVRRVPVLPARGLAVERGGSAAYQGRVEARTCTGELTAESPRERRDGRAAEVLGHLVEAELEARVKRER